jgi:hypothetical protein
LLVREQEGGRGDPGVEYERVKDSCTERGRQGKGRRGLDRHATIRLMLEDHRSRLT